MIEIKTVEEAEECFAQLDPSEFTADNFAGECAPNDHEFERGKILTLQNIIPLGWNRADKINCPTSFPAYVIMLEHKPSGYRAWIEAVNITFMALAEQFVNTHST